MDELKIWGAMKERLESLQAGTFGTLSNAPAKSLTLADLKAAVRDIDPDGRWLQEARLCVECRKLSKEDVEIVIRFAHSLVENQSMRAAVFYRDEEPPTP